MPLDEAGLALIDRLARAALRRLGHTDAVVGPAEPVVALSLGDVAGFLDGAGPPRPLGGGAWRAAVIADDGVVAWVEVYAYEGWEGAIDYRVDLDVPPLSKGPRTWIRVPEVGWEALVQAEEGFGPDTKARLVKEWGTRPAGARLPLDTLLREILDAR